MALGFGIQNYSCAGAGAAPAATGALAMLYDAAAVYRALPAADAANLTAHALWSHAVPLNLVDGGGASPSQPFAAAAPLELPGLAAPLPFVGHHFFDAGGVPTFDLDGGAAGRVHMPSAKLGAVAAPAVADAGPQRTGAVGWLYLGEKPGAGAVGAKYLYRVLTAGGASHGCDGAGSDSTPYAALYWFYG